MDATDRSAQAMTPAWRRPSNSQYSLQAANARRTRASRPWLLATVCARHARKCKRITAWCARRRSSSTLCRRACTRRRLQARAITLVAHVNLATVVGSLTAAARTVCARTPGSWSADLRAMPSWHQRQRAWQPICTLTRHVPCSLLSQAQRQVYKRGPRPGRSHCIDSLPSSICDRRAPAVTQNG